MKQVKVVFIGIGGYASTYINEVLDHPDSQIKIEGLIAPYPAGYSRLLELTSQSIPLFAEMESFFRTHTTDLAVITTPIHLHTRQILCALSHRANVLCEKPLCADETGIRLLQDARDAAGKLVHIGYQWFSSKVILALKRDCMADQFGAAELLRANNIENFDKARICCTMPGGAKATFLAAYPVYQTLNPIFTCRFEQAVICFAQNDTPLTRSLLRSQNRLIWADGPFEAMICAYRHPETPLLSFAAD